MLRVYYVPNDCICEVIPEFRVLGLKSAKIMTDGVIFQYINNEKLNNYFNIAKKYDERCKDLGDFTIEELETEWGAFPELRKYFGN